MKAFVQNQHGKPLMPTTPQEARLLLKHGKARIVKYEPFMIQLYHGTSGYKQKIRLGVDSGYETIGYSAIANKEELISGQLNLLKRQSERLKERSMYRIKDVYENVIVNLGLRTDEKQKRKVGLPLQFSTS